MENGVISTKAEGFLSRMALNDNKAGMEGLDRDKINKIIMESSKVETTTQIDLVLCGIQIIFHSFTQVICKLLSPVSEKDNCCVRNDKDV